MEAFVCVSPRVVGVEKLGRNSKHQSHFPVCFMLCIFLSIDTLFAAWQVSVIRILCSSYYILHISRHYISVGTEALTRTFRTDISYLKHARLDHHMMTMHMRIVARAFLQLSTGPPAMPIKSCREQALPRVSVCVSPVFRLPFVSVDVICPRRTLDGTSPLLHRRCTPSETAASD